MKILIADDHWMVRASLKQVMRRLRQRLDAFEAETFDEAIHLLSTHPDIDLVLIDLVMPGFDEFTGLQRLRNQFPNVPVVVVSVHEDVEHVMRSVQYGVIGYIPKSSDGPEIEAALERVLAGEVSFPRRVIERSGTPATAAAKNQDMPSAGALDTLTGREREVLSLLGRGLSVKRIAENLELSPQTVRVHLSNLMKKLNLADRSSTIHYAINVANGGAAVSGGS